MGKVMGEMKDTLLCEMSVAFYKVHRLPSLVLIKVV
jgi:hypothetical protein